MSNETVILITFFGFCALAFILLAPIYRFLNREEEASKKWTKKELARQLREEKPSSNGHDQEPAAEGGDRGGAHDEK